MSGLAAATGNAAGKVAEFVLQSLATDVAGFCNLHGSM